ncbi:pyrrolo-quinoline quinone, partial [bacterium]|nr:pyrrolo-quinoline quinone [bacterium]
MKTRLLICLVIFVCFGASFAVAEEWPQWLGPTRNSVWNEKGIIRQFPKDGPKVLWKSKVSGGFSGPAVAGNKVFVPDFVVKSGDSTNDFNKRDERSGNERLLCFEAKSGALLWKYEYPVVYKISYASGPRVTPSVVDGKVYGLGAEGNFFCLDVNTGKPIWTKDFKKDYNAPTPLWGFCGHPLIKGDLVYCLVGGEGSVAVAFNKDTGKEVWKALSASESGYCPPTLINAAGVDQLLIWDADKLNSLDLASG